MTDAVVEMDVAEPGAPGKGAGLFLLEELGNEDFQHLVRRSWELFQRPGDHRSPLAGAIVGTLFMKTSTRTRTAFTTAALRLGGQVIGYGPNDLQLATGESIEDTGRVLSVMLDAVVARTAGPVSQLRELSNAGGLPVVNAMAAEEHPTQAIADLGTIAHVMGSEALDGLRLLYVGEGNNTATALASAMARLTAGRAVFATPAGYGLPPRSIAAAQCAGDITEVHDLDSVTGDFDIVYTTRWQTTGTSKTDPHWRERFRRFYVDQDLMNRWPSALLMHDLPAHRGEEVAHAVLDGPRSIAWTQARMKAASAMAVMEWLFTARPGGQR